MFGWKSKGLTESITSITTPATPSNCVAPSLNYIINAKIPSILDGSCLKQYKTPFAHRKVVKRFIVYELDIWSRDLNIGFTLKICLFGAVKLTKKPDKVLDLIHDLFFLISKFNFSKNVIIFGVDSISSTNAEKKALVLGVGSTQGLHDS